MTERVDLTMKKWTKCNENNTRVVCLIVPSQVRLCALLIVCVPVSVLVSVCLSVRLSVCRTACSPCRERQ